METYGAALESSAAALKAYMAHELDLVPIALDFLGATAAAYRTLGVIDAENEMLALRAQLVSAHGGVNPRTLERVARHRRELERTITLSVLQASADRLRDDYASTRDALAQAREQLLPIVAYALGKGLIPADPGHEYTAQELEELWQVIIADPEIQPSARQLGMRYSLADIVVILGDLLAASSGGPSQRSRDS